jgi:uncharacterized protein DUF1877
MSTDGYFRPLSRAALTVIAGRPEAAALLKRFDPWFKADDPESGWPQHVRAMYAWLVAAGERDPEEVRELAAEMSQVNFWGEVAEDEVRELIASRLTLDDVPPSVQVCGAGWPELHFLLTGAPWSPGTPLAQALGRREVGSAGLHGATRLLNPAEVATAAGHLCSVRAEEMAGRYAAARPRQPFPPAWEERRAEWIGSYGEVCDQFVDARARGHGMMVYVA